MPATDYAINRGTGGNLDPGVSVSDAGTFGSPYVMPLVAPAYGASGWSIAGGASVFGPPATLLVSMWVNKALLSPTGTPTEFNGGADLTEGLFALDLDPNSFVEGSYELNVPPNTTNSGGVNPFDPTGLHHYLFSMDEAGNQMSLAIDGVAQSISPSWNMNNPFNDMTQWFLVGDDGDIWGDFWASAPAVYVDATDAAVIAKFISGGKPVYLGNSGELPFGSSPPLYYSLGQAPGGYVGPSQPKSGFGFGFGSFGGFGGTSLGTLASAAAMSAGLPASAGGGSGWGDLAAKAGRSRRANYWPDFKVAEGVR